MPAATNQRTFTVKESAGAARREATQAEILAAVERLLNSGESLAGLSVNRIASEAGVSRATFYLYFPDKRELVVKLAERELLEWDRTTSRFFGDPQADREALESVGRELVSLWRDHAGVLSALIELAEYDAQARAAWLDTVGTIATKISATVSARRPGLSNDEAEVLGQAIAWMGERTCHQMVAADSDEATVERVAHGLAEAVWCIVSGGDAAEPA